jgi:hypothetical protein
MRITESQLRRIVRDEIASLSEGYGEAPSVPYRPPVPGPMGGVRRNPLYTDIAGLIRSLGADKFAEALVRALGDSERARSIANYIKEYR